MSYKASEEQVLYANIMNIGMLIGLAGLGITFILYGTGILEPMIPIEQVQNYWVLPVNEFLKQSGMVAGWTWLGQLEYGDMLNFVPIAFLSLLTIVCYMAILPGLIRKKDTPFVIIAILEIIVLAVAASGILGAGGH